MLAYAVSVAPFSFHESILLRQYGGAFGHLNVAECQWFAGLLRDAVGSFGGGCGGG